ncbi:Anaphase-promoting complex subunit 10 [Dermatophagoides farinae]|uniref:Anaphase-promoting complex subunit 10 n=1 Tax=Dermatophagoides farinae TaxID=6954 RepID=A0A922L8G4_DERFA|nr:Anaphase-promoting complex subunit 10 [Dermatophagoides farinae]
MNNLHRSSINVINTSKSSSSSSMKNNKNHQQSTNTMMMLIDQTNSSDEESNSNNELKRQKSVVREIGSQAVWSLSSCKVGFGVEQLRDNCKDTYWQSDGVQPHLVNIQFRRKTTVCEIKIFADFKLDESYTPNKISVRAGNHFHDLHEGWETIPLRDADDHPIRAFLIQIAVLGNHQNGRDTHIRQIKINSPVEDTVVTVKKLPQDFRTIRFWKHACLR